MSDTAEHPHVFVLNMGFDYEGERTIGVFASLDSAKSKANALAEVYGWTEYEWQCFDGRWERQYGGSAFIVHQMAVQS
jgi:hypothetical protein